MHIHHTLSPSPSSNFYKKNQPPQTLELKQKPHSLPKSVVVADTGTERATYKIYRTLLFIHRLLLLPAVPPSARYSYFIFSALFFSPCARPPSAPPIACAPHHLLLSARTFQQFSILVSHHGIHNM